MLGACTLLSPAQMAKRANSTKPPQPVRWSVDRKLSARSASEGAHPSLGISAVTAAKISHSLNALVRLKNRCAHLRRPLQLAPQRIAYFRQYAARAT
jgi:hypothetical protein